MKRCLVIVSRDEPELFERLISLYAQDDWIEILRDRRQGGPWTEAGATPDRRSPPRPDSDLKDHGFIVIQQP
jgi:hypothetical protein